MKICPKCRTSEYTKDGMAGGKQRYKCKSCRYRYTVEQRGFSSDIKRQAIILYLQGVDFRSIGYILHCSHVTVHNWIKSYGNDIEKIRSKSEVQWTHVNELQNHFKTKDNADIALLLIDLNNKASTTLCISKKDLKTMNKHLSSSKHGK